MSSPKVAILIYSMYGHIAKCAYHYPALLQPILISYTQWPRQRRRALRPLAGPPLSTSTSRSAHRVLSLTHGRVFSPRIAETLPEEVLAKMHAPAKPNYPVLEPGDLAQFDAFLFGIPTRYGNFPGQWKAFWDATGQLWATGALFGKFAGVFVSTASSGGGQESTVLASISTLVHHGINFVPLGYAKAFGQLTNLSEVRGGECSFPSSSPTRIGTAYALSRAYIHPMSFNRAP